jgi:hypothetical protein
MPEAYDKNFKGNKKKQQKGVKTNYCVGGSSCRIVYSYASYSWFTINHDDLLKTPPNISVM